MTISPGEICLYAQGAQNLDHFERGIPRYVVEHTRALVNSHRELLHSVVLDRRFPLTGNLAWLAGTGLLDWQAEQPSSALKPPSVYHVMSPFDPDLSAVQIWPHWARNADVATVVTLYDLIPMVFADHYLADPRVRSEYQARVGLIRSADQVLAISQITADDVIERLGVPEDHVHVIHAGATDTFASMFTAKESAHAHRKRTLPRIRPGFLLYVGGFEFRKNLDGLIQGYARMPAEVRRQHQMVIVCRLLPSEERQLRELGRQLGLSDEELILTGYIDDRSLAALYRTCRLFVFPSLYEGSGLPILEAMSCEAPVAAAETSTGPELMGDPRATFNPASPESIARCLTDLIDDEEELEQLQARSRQRVAEYTWRHVAEHSVVGYERALSVKTRSRRRHRPRLAIVTPWMPEPSGIAEYNRQLIEQLGHDIDVDVVVAQGIDSYPVPREPHTRLIEADSFGSMRRLRQYDQVLYCMGNSIFHLHVFELLAQHPGAVIFHDVQMTGFYGTLAGRDHPEDPRAELARRIDGMYGDRLPRGEASGGSLHWSRLSALGIYMTREIQVLAQQSFVHSSFSADVLRLEQAGSDDAAAVTVLPFACPEPRRPPRDAPSSSPLIVSLGYVSEIKGLATLIRAFSHLVETLPQAKLVLAGPVDAAGREQWTQYIADHAPSADIELTGWVDRRTLDDLISSADLCVQLRTVSNGEASASVAEALCDGLPTIVTDLGWASDLPETTVTKVPADITPERLSEIMSELLREDSAYAKLSASALEYARTHSFADVAASYREVLGL